MGQIILTSQSEAALEQRVIKYLTFKLGEDVYGVEVMHVKKIIEYTRATHLPMTPTFIKGVLNLLGGVVPVIELTACFGEEPSPITKRTCIVIVELSPHGEQSVDMGIIVDAVHNVIELPPESISPPPDFGDSIRTNFLCGIGRLNEMFIMLLDINRLFSKEQLSALYTARQAIGSPKEHNAAPNKSNGSSS